MQRLSQQEFAEIKNALVSRLRGLGIERCYLFGSFARGDHHYGSDLDLCIVRDGPGDWFERTLETQRALEDVPIHVEAHVYSPEEFDQLRKDRNPLVEQILREGELLFER